MRKSPRQRRLEADFRSVKELDSVSSIFSFSASGDPPTRYRLHFEGPGISRDSLGEVQIVEKHEIIVELGASYPRMVPNLLWQTPIFHPNISNNGVVCLGGYGTHWVPSLTLDEMSTMLWDMIRYKNFDIQSPYNREAALWARDQKRFLFPLDDRNIRDLVNNPEPARTKKQTHATVVESPPQRSGKSVFGVIGALANRIRDRRQAESAATESPHSREQQVIEDVSIVEASVIDDESTFVDPSEIEIVEDGIAFLDSSGNIESDLTNEAAEDSGIVFLD